MYFGIKTSRLDKSQVIRFTFNYMLVLALSALTAIILSRTLWNRQTILTHTVIELICIFIAFSSFMIVWFTFSASSVSNRIIGFGFLAVGIFDTLHTYFFTLALLPGRNYDLSVRYWLFGRFAEAAVLFLSTAGFIKVRLNKYISLMISLILSCGVAFALYYFKGILPLLIGEQGVTLTKIIIEYFIAAIFITSFFNLFKRLNRKSVLSYKYIFMAVLIAIPAELCFTHIESMVSLAKVYGHVLKIVSCYYLFRGIFASAVTYPYNAVTKTKDKLREAKHELRDILNGLPLALVKYDNNKRVVFANKKALELLECTTEVIVGKNLDQMKQTLKLDRNNLVEAVSSNPGLVLNAIREYSTFKGNKISLNVNAFSYKNGTLISFSDTKKDQELSDLKIQTRTILNAINNNVIITDTNFNIIMFNKAFKLCIEMRDGDILGKDLNSLFNELQLIVNNLPFSAIGSMERNEKFEEATFLTPRGNKKVILMNYNPIFNVKDEAIGYIFVSSDITELKNEQQKALSQEKLAVIGQMGSGIVHETKNHLAAIRGYCQLLEKKIHDTKLRKYVERIEAISEDINNVVIDFLSLAKPSETVMDIISINETIEGIRYMLESPSFIKGVKININLCEHDNDIKGDETQIKQVILNMTKNAIEAMSDTENPILYISTETCDEEGKMRLIISDNGKGISKENLEKIGNLFFTTKDTGTGIGLNLCYRIIDEHEGSIEVHSEEGMGTTFIISIPYYSEQ